MWYFHFSIYAVIRAYTLAVSTVYQSDNDEHTLFLQTMD